MLALLSGLDLQPGRLLVPHSQVLLYETRIVDGTTSAQHPRSRTTRENMKHMAKYAEDVPWSTPTAVVKPMTCSRSVGWAMSDSVQHRAK